LLVVSCATQIARVQELASKKKEWAASTFDERRGICLEGAAAAPVSFSALPHRGLLISTT